MKSFLKINLLFFLLCLNSCDVETCEDFNEREFFDEWHQEVITSAYECCKDTSKQNRILDFCYYLAKHRASLFDTLIPMFQKKGDNLIVVETFQTKYCMTIYLKDEAIRACQGKNVDIFIMDYANMNRLFVEERDDNCCEHSSEDYTLLKGFIRFKCVTRITSRNSRFTFEAILNS